MIRFWNNIQTRYKIPVLQYLEDSLSSIIQIKLLTEENIFANLTIHLVRLDQGNLKEYVQIIRHVRKDRLIYVNIWGSKLFIYSIKGLFLSLLVSLASLSCGEAMRLAMKIGEKQSPVIPHNIFRISNIIGPEIISQILWRKIDVLWYVQLR